MPRRLDAVDVAVRESRRFVREPRSFRDVAPTQVLPLARPEALHRAARRREACPEDRLCPCGKQPVNLVLSSEPQTEFFFPTGLLGARRHEGRHLARRAELLREVHHREARARRRNSTLRVRRDIVNAQARRRAAHLLEDRRRRPKAAAARPRSRARPICRNSASCKCTSSAAPH